MEKGKKNRRMILEVNSNAQQCSLSVTEDCITSSQIDLGSSGDYSFTNCTFSGCYSMNMDCGAICLLGTNTSSRLSIERCVFNSCEVKPSQNGTLRGGAVRCGFAETFVVTSSNFTDCHTPNGQLSYNSSYLGGALYGQYISRFLCDNLC